jgi:hypothetical protein
MKNDDGRRPAPSYPEPADRWARTVTRCEREGRYDAALARAPMSPIDRLLLPRIPESYRDMCSECGVDFMRPLGTDESRCLPCCARVTSDADAIEGDLAAANEKLEALEGVEDQVADLETQVQRQKDRADDLAKVLEDARRMLVRLTRGVPEDAPADDPRRAVYADLDEMVARCDEVL